MDNKGHRGDHGWVHNIDFEKVCNQDIFNSSSWWEAHFFLAVIFKSNFFLKAYLKIMMFKRSQKLREFWDICVV